MIQCSRLFRSLKWCGLLISSPSIKHDLKASMRESQSFSWLLSMKLLREERIQGVFIILCFSRLKSSQLLELGLGVEITCKEHTFVRDNYCQLFKDWEIPRHRQREVSLYENKEKTDVAPSLIVTNNDQQIQSQLKRLQIVATNKTH